MSEYDVHISEIPMVPVKLDRMIATQIPSEEYLERYVLDDRVPALPD